MATLSIIHFHPIELYPPIQNLLTFFSKNNERLKINVYTNRTTKEVPVFKSPSNNIHIIRLSVSDHSFHSLKRYYNYIKFYCGTIISLLKNTPTHVLYYDTLSSFPIFVITKIFKKKIKIFIHYHEYLSKREYETGMKLVNYFHQKEKLLYPIAGWVSHTNELRMQDFIKDLLPIRVNNPHLLPNYPPPTWESTIRDAINYPVKVVSMGAISKETMYLEEFAHWVISQKGKVKWDIISLNIEDEVKEYFKILDSAHINILPGVAYDQVPILLQQYDIGVILYKGVIPNHINVIPNKLFEYLVCGLDVWFPIVMTGSYSTITNHTYPKVISIDFTKLNDMDLDQMIDRSGYTLKISNFSYEHEYAKLSEELLKN